MTEGCLTSLFYEDPPMLPTHLFSNYVHPTGTHTHTHLFGSTHVAPWYLSTRRTLMCVLCNKASSLLRSDTCGFLLVLWFDIKHTHNTAQHIQGPVDWHSYKYLYTTYVLTAAIYYINKWLNDIKNLLYIMSFLFKYSSHVSYVCWLDAIRLGSPCKTEITLKMV